MSTPKDTLSRLLTLVQLIPLSPRYVNTTTLHEKLTERGYRIDVRTVQRDLELRLAQSFPIICDSKEKPYRWSLGSVLNVQQLDTPSALALHLVNTEVQNLLPQSVADQVKPLFTAAHRHLNNLQHNGVADWAKVIRLLSNGRLYEYEIINFPSQISENKK